MSEYWLISAPGEKTCQQTFDTLNNVTSHEHNLSINYKFPIPDLKVGTLDQLVGLSDDLGKLDTYVEQITRKVASYLGEVLEDQRDKLHENLLANNWDSKLDPSGQLSGINEVATAKDNDGIIDSLMSALNETISNNNDNNENVKISQECITDASDAIMAAQTQNNYVIITPYNCNRNCHASREQYSSDAGYSVASKNFLFKHFMNNNHSKNNNTCKINNNIQKKTRKVAAAANTLNNTPCNSDGLNNAAPNSVGRNSYNNHYHDQQKQLQQQQDHQHHYQQHKQFLKYFNKIFNGRHLHNCPQSGRINEHQQTAQQHEQQQQQQQSHINQNERINISDANASHYKKIFKNFNHKHYHHNNDRHHDNFNLKYDCDDNCIWDGNSNGKSYHPDEDDIVGLKHTLEWWCQYVHPNEKFINIHTKSVRRQRSSECCCSCCRGNNSHNSSPDHDIRQVLGLPKSPHPGDLSAYITRFQWDMAKYPIKQSLRNIADIISKQVGQIDADLKTKATAYNNLKGNLQNLEKKQTGSLLTRNLADLVKKEHFILDSEYLTTLLVIVPKVLSNEWLAHYEKITDMIVPRSSMLINQDNDYCLFNVTLFKKVVDEFKLHAREKKFIVRDFEYNEEEMAAGKNEITKLITDKKKQFGPLVRWLKVNFSEAFCALIHVKALRVFVESVLRYGLPVNFQAILIQPHKKSIKRLRECLNQLYGHLDGSSAGAQASGLENVDIPGLGFGQAEYYPYVFYKINIDMIDTKA